MREATDREYRKFARKERALVFGDRIGKRTVNIEIGKQRRITGSDYQPKKFEIEGTTVWSFPHRGDWATHKGDYRGNWPPQMARNIILRYSKPKELVLDQMCGSGTTMIECKLLGRNGIGVDINPAALMLTRDRLNFKNPTSLQVPKTFQRTYIGDARKLNLIETESVDLIATHPPYTNIVPYSKEKLAVDLSSVHNVGKYVDEMRTVASESLRVLKPGRYMAILVGDTRSGKHYVPIAFRIMHMFLETGFILKEDIVKLQWRCKATPFWLKKSIEANFFLLMHEHLFVFRKPESEEDISKFQGSAAW